MLVNEYKPEFYDRKVRKMRDLGNFHICESPFVMSRTDAQNGLYSIFNISPKVHAFEVLRARLFIHLPECSKTVKFYRMKSSIICSLRNCEMFRKKAVKISKTVDFRL